MKIIKLEKDCKKNVQPVLDLGYYSLLSRHLICSGYERKTELRWVKIYFATPTFDKITKDEKANFETRISAIGGTMGLLTGFSILSGVELLYFAVKIFFGTIFSKKTRKGGRHGK